MITNAKEIIADSSIKQTLENYGYTMRKEGSAYLCRCPNCGEDAKSKGLKLFKNDKLGKCFQCDTTLNSFKIVAIEEKLDAKADYTKIVEKLASIHGFAIHEKETKTKEKSAPKPKRQKLQPSSTQLDGQSFRDKQLQESGITVEAQKAWYIDNSNDKPLRAEIDLFASGTINDAGEFAPGDDMVIRKIDLDRNIRVYFKPKKTKGEFYSKPLEEWRIRYKIPEHHLDRNGKEMKYSSPYGSTGSPFHPEPVLNAFEKGIQYETYYIDEGEKKATKRNMHGMYGSGAMGINNLAQNMALHSDFDRIIKRNGVKNVVFTLDADCFDISTDLKKPIDLRPLSFLAAVRNYKDYFYALTNQGIELNIFIAWVNKNEHNEKGIDDLLAGSLKGKEAELKEDYENAMRNQPSGVGKYVTVVNITGYSEQKLKGLFHLSTREKLVEFHSKTLLDLRTDEEKENHAPVQFYLGKSSTRWALHENGTLELAQPLSEEEIFWRITHSKKGEFIDLDYKALDTFMRNQLVGRLTISKENEKGEWKLVRAYRDNKVVKDMSAQEICDYIFEFLRETGEDKVYNFLRKNKEVLNEKTFMASPKLDMVINFLKHDYFSQYLFFQNGFWKVTAEGTNVYSIQDSPGYVTPGEVIRQSPKYISEKLINFTQLENGSWALDITPTGAECHILQFLLNASNFNWRDTQRIESELLTVTDNTVKENLRSKLQEYNTETANHLINKMTGIGYMCHSIFNPGCAKAVIAMDGKNNSIQDSFGRSGKSILIDILSQVVETVKIDGKKPNVTDDPFAFQEVTLETKVIAYDDVRPNFDFTRLFSGITGNTKLRGLHRGEVTIPREKTPHYLITTNYFVNGDSDSYQDRQFFILFSDYYNKSHKPTHDFKTLFFDEWEPENKQWDLFFTFIAECIHLYLKHGLIEVGGELVRNKQLRGKIGEDFLQFMNDYFYTRVPEIERARLDAMNYSFDGNIYGVKIERKPMQQAFFEENPNEKKWTNSNKFSEKLKLWAEYNDLILNKNIPKINRKTLKVEAPHGGMIKTGGNEYYTFDMKDDNLLIAPAEENSSDDYNEEDF